MRKFKHIVFAGTFDRLHVGHKKLLVRAFELGEKVFLAITTEKLYQTKLLSDQILSWEDRKKEVEEYLIKRGSLDRAIFYKLDDIFGSSITDSTMDAILVTEITKKNAEKINEIRIKNKLRPLSIVIEELVRDGEGSIISSERIRKGEIDREGNVYQIIKYQDKKEMKLPSDLRSKLREPLGKVIKGEFDQLIPTAKKIIQTMKLPNDKTDHLELKSALVISVGDIVTKSLIDAGLYPDVSIIDFKSRRKDINLELNPHEFISQHCINEPGTINIDAAGLIKKAIDNYLQNRKKQLIVIKGEEDLLALPAILFAPLYSVIIYGQFDRGVVMVEVKENIKKRVKRILEKFK